MERLHGETNGAATPQERLPSLAVIHTLWEEDGQNLTIQIQSTFVCHIWNYFIFPFKNFGRHKCFLWAVGTPVLDFWWCLPWVSKPGGCRTCVFCHLHTVDSSDSPLVRHLLTSWQPAMQPRLFCPHTWLRNNYESHFVAYFNKYPISWGILTIYIQTILTNTLSPLYLVNLTKNAHMNTKQNIGVGTCLTGILNLFQVSFSFLFFFFTNLKIKG